jgi:hypothetical protein
LADNVELDPGTGGAVIATDDISSVHYQYVKLTSGTDQATTPVAAGGGVEANALRVTVASDSTGVLSVDDNGSTLSVDDGAGSLTVDNAALSVTGGGTEATALRVTVATDSTGVLSVDDNGGSLTVDGTVTANLAAGTNNIGDVDVLTLPNVTNGGTFVVQENGAALTALQVIGNPVFVDDAAFTVGTSSVNVVGFLADQASTDSVNEGDVGAARMTLDRKIVTTIAPSADTEGWDVANNIDVDETEDAVKASAGKLGGYYWYNDGASEVYIKYYNDTVANVIVGTTAPFMTIALPAGAAANVEWTNGIAFSAAITVAATTGAATADTGAPAANQVVGFSLYK